MRSHDPQAPGSAEPDAAVHADLDRLRATMPPGHGVVLLAGSVSNAEDLADAYGHDGLASVTRQVVDRVAREAAGAATVLRCSPLGGFLVAIGTGGSLGAEADDEAVQRAAEACRGFALLDGVRVWPVVSAALRACRPGETAAQGLREIGTSLYETGRHHRGCVRWAPQVQQPDAPPGASAVRRELELVADLATALLHEPTQISMAYQPVFDLRSRTLISAEALMRWQHPVHGPVSPMVAVEAAERTGLIHPLGALVLDLALAQTAAWRGHVGPAYRTHVNVSALELQAPGYVEGVAAALERHGLPPHLLLLEITETALLTQDQAVLATLYKLRALGVGLGIDDFGTGYSSISHLHRLPIDTVKIDRSLVIDIGTSPADFSMIRTVLGLLGTTQVTVIAEGIEDVVQASHLQAVGAMFGQGYLLGRPMRPEVFMPAVAPLPRPRTA